MRKITILLACLVCAGHGRRLQQSVDPRTIAYEGTAANPSIEQAKDQSSFISLQGLAILLLALNPTGAFSVASPRAVSTWTHQKHQVPKVASASLDLSMQHMRGTSRHGTAPVAFATDELPPPMPKGKAFSSGILGSAMPTWWRQTSTHFQLICQLPDGISIKNDLNINSENGNFLVKVGDDTVVQGSLPHPIIVEETLWFVEDDLDGFPASARYLIVELSKAVQWLDWPGPVAAGETPQKFIVGGCDEDAQKDATATQVAVYQTLGQLPCTNITDIYIRPIPSKVNRTEYCYLRFVGRVASDEFVDPYAAIGTQEVLVKQHARLLWADKNFTDLKDDEMELWTAEGNTEIKVASFTTNVTKWPGPPEDVELPTVLNVGFSPYSIFDGEERFFARRDANGGAVPDGEIKFDDQ